MTRRARSAYLPAREPHRNILRRFNLDRGVLYALSHASYAPIFGTAALSGILDTRHVVQSAADLTEAPAPGQYLKVDDLDSSGTEDLQDMDITTSRCFTKLAKDLHLN